MMSGLGVALAAVLIVIAASGSDDDTAKTGQAAGGLTVATTAEASSRKLSRRQRLRRSGDRSVAPRRPQKRAGKLSPAINEALKDKSRMWTAGCQVDPEVTRTPKKCVFGKRGGNKTMVITGDSHGLMYFPALDRLAKKHNWRLLGLTKVGCPTNTSLVYNKKVGRGYTECLRWNEWFVKHMRKVKPELIVTSSWARHTVMPDGKNGKRLKEDSKRNKRLLKKGYIRQLNKLKRSGAKLAVMKDTPMSPHWIPPCIKRNKTNLRRCAFRIPRDYESQSQEREIAHAVGKRAKMVKIHPVWCPRKRCHAVINDRIVFRDDNHITATYSRTLWRQMKRRLPKAG